MNHYFLETDSDMIHYTVFEESRNFFRIHVKKKSLYSDIQDYYSLSVPTFINNQRTINNLIPTDAGFAEIKERIILAEELSDLIFKYNSYFKLLAEKFFSATFRNFYYLHELRKKLDIVDEVKEYNPEIYHDMLEAYNKMEPHIYNNYYKNTFRSMLKNVPKKYHKIFPYDFFSVYSLMLYTNFIPEIDLTENGVYSYKVNPCTFENISNHFSSDYYIFNNEVVIAYFNNKLTLYCSNIEDSFSQILDILTTIEKHEEFLEDKKKFPENIEKTHKVLHERYTDLILKNKTNNSTIWFDFLHFFNISEIEIFAKFHNYHYSLENKRPENIDDYYFNTISVRNLIQHVKYDLFMYRIYKLMFNEKVNLRKNPDNNYIKKTNLDILKNFSNIRKNFIQNPCESTENKKYLDRRFSGLLTQILYISQKKELAYYKDAYTADDIYFENIKRFEIDLAEFPSENSVLNKIMCGNNNVRNLSFLKNHLFLTELQVQISENNKTDIDTRFLKKMFWMINIKLKNIPECYISDFKNLTQLNCLELTNCNILNDITDKIDFRKLERLFLKNIKSSDSINPFTNCRNIKYLHILSVNFNIDSIIGNNPEIKTLSIHNQDFNTNYLNNLNNIEELYLNLTNTKEIRLLSSFSRLMYFELTVYKAEYIDFYKTMNNLKNSITINLNYSTPEIKIHESFKSLKTIYLENVQELDLSIFRSMQALKSISIDRLKKTAILKNIDTLNRNIKLKLINSDISNILSELTKKTVKCEITLNNCTAYKEEDIKNNPNVKTCIQDNNYTIIDIDFDFDFDLPDNI
ncbi:MAG: hypothetical protein M0R46_15755 [Candidatus Muirbacterium halophilum]|nr:hypothetical protein [Candidatus Muirbacterium halophilum]MCK9477371.1 hypothetical protein [Candidatus Muirbacterium halophilum]